MRRAPSPRDYERMTERVRVAAAEIAEHQARTLEAARDRLTGADWLRPLRAGAEAERRAAAARHAEDTPETCRDRVLLAHLEAEAVACRKHRAARTRRAS
ncbi:hypothetical protein HF998_02640 [Cellulomonas hominis]|nr:hypothetical protein [Cellulomonas hominis]